MKYTTKEAVHNRGCEAIGKQLSDLAAAMNRKTSGKKSQAGDAWESWFGVKKNSAASPDLEEAHIELKATGAIYTSNGWSAKERLVLNIINYIEEFDKHFENSSFWLKNQFIELGFYKYEKEKPWTDWIMLKSVLYTFPIKDLLIIKQDWEKIHDYIKTGKAHELSEGLTMYLGACPKGANKKTMREQHPSLNAPPAMQRAYSLKNGYMTYLLREYVFGENEDDNIRIDPFEAGEVFEPKREYYTSERVVKDIAVLKDTTLEDYIVNTLANFRGAKTSDLLKKFDIKKTTSGSYAKNILAMLASRMLGIYGDLERTEEFFKAEIDVRTIRILNNGKNKESISFPSFKFKELANEKWEESTLYQKLESTKFLLLVFKEKDNDYIFQGAKFWSVPELELNTTIKAAWQETVDTLNKGVELYYDGKNVRNNFIGSGDKRIIHVRPHASKASYMAGSVDADELPVSAKWDNKPSKFSDKWMTKQCFWLNQAYMFEVVKDLL
jgi:DNA mismatch repair protein MutH